MDAPANNEDLKRLTKAEADALATEFMDALRQLPFGSQARGLEDVATVLRFGLPFAANLSPTTAQPLPPFFDAVLGPIPLKLTEEELIKAKKLQRKIVAQPPQNDTELHSDLKRSFLKLPPAGISMIRDVIERLKAHAANPVGLRNQIINQIRQNVKGTPGPRRTIPSGAHGHLVECSKRLREVCFKLLTFSEKESKQPLSKIIEAVASLHPEWNGECTFLTSHMDLIESCLRLAKIKNAKVRGKASKLADALACEYAGYSVRPSYSMQILEQARRSQKA